MGSRMYDMSNLHPPGTTSGLLAALDKPRVSAADPYIGYQKKAKAPTNASQESNQEVDEDYDTVK